MLILLFGLPYFANSIECCGANALEWKARGLISTRCPAPATDWRDAPPFCFNAQHIKLFRGFPSALFSQHRQLKRSDYSQLHRFLSSASWKRCLPNGRHSGMLNPPVRSSLQQLWTIVFEQNSICLLHGCRLRHLGIPHDYHVHPKWLVPNVPSLWVWTAVRESPKDLIPFGILHLPNLKKIAFKPKRKEGKMT